MTRSFSRLAVLSLSLLCALSGASAVFGLGKSKAAASGEVLVLDGASSFEEALKAHPFLVVEFYAPWCGHCKKLEPEWTQAANAGVEVTLAKADATLASNKELSERFGVRGYPTLKMFVGHSADAPRDYAGPREADGIVTYLTKQSGPASVELKSAAEAEALVASEDVLVVGIFPSGAPSETFMATAQRLRDEYTFAHVSSASLLPGGAAADPATTVVVFKSFDDPSVAATTADVTDADTLSAWIAHTALPLVARLDKEPKNRAAMRRVFEFKAPKVLVFAKYDGAVELQLSAALTAGAKAHPELKFVVGDATDNDGALQFFGFTAEDLPAAVIHDTTDGAGDKKYARAKLVLGELDGWLQDFKAGKLSPTIKSEPLPTPNDGPVTILVAKNFADIVVPSKTILLEFYAPWCGHCKTLAPIYDKVGAHFADNANVVIAKMDATANDVTDPRFAVKGFPTLYLQTATGEVVPYSGDRSESDIVKFVSDHLDGAQAVAPEGAPAPEVKDEL